MKVLRVNGILLVLLTLIVAGPRPAAAQSDVTSADIQRLQDSIYDASRDIAQVRSRDASLASQLQNELDDVRDEATYLKVKLRKHESIARSEYADVRDRIENIRSRARSDAPGGYSTPGSGRSSSEDRPTSPVRSQNPNEVPVGAEFDVRLQNQLSSGTAQVEDKFEATKIGRAHV